MAKMLTLFLIFILTLASLAGYLYLTKQITAGSLKIAAGEIQIKQGEEMLAKGKAKLASGKQQLSRAKTGYQGIKTASYVTMAAIPVAGVLSVVGNKMVGNKIAAGSQQVAAGQKKINAGEAQLKAGKLELSRGMERLNQANKIRIACAVGIVFFGSLFIVLVCCWRRSLILFFKRKTS